MQQSWSDKLVERIRNVIKRDRIKCGCAEEEETPAAKRPKKETALLSRYPVSAGTDYSTEFAEDAESLAGHIESIKKEMEKDRPRDSLLAQLMKSTYRSRRDLIVTGSVPVAQILQDFPALKRPSMVCICSHTDIHVYYICDPVCEKGSYSLSNCIYMVTHNLTGEYSTSLQFGHSTTLTWQ